MQRLLATLKPQLALLSPDELWRETIFRVIVHPAFDKIIMTAICLNAVAMMMEHRNQSETCVVPRIAVLSCVALRDTRWCLCSSLWCRVFLSRLVTLSLSLSVRCVQLDGCAREREPGVLVHLRCGGGMSPPLSLAIHVACWLCQRLHHSRNNSSSCR
jgi:hypothetical protein